MFWPFSIHRLTYPKEKYIWAQVRILHETEKAKKTSLFEIYVKESTVA